MDKKGLYIMKIKYLGPSLEIEVVPYGKHRQNIIKEYPEDFGNILLTTSKKQRFEKIIDLPVEQINQEMSPSPITDTNIEVEEYVISEPDIKSEKENLLNNNHISTEKKYTAKNNLRKKRKY